MKLYTLISKKRQYVKIKARGTDEKVQEAISFCSNDALNLSQYPSVVNAACDAIKKFGVSASSSVALSGYSKLYSELEELLSQFKNFQYTTFFLNAWMGIKSLLEALCYRTISYISTYPKRNVLILCDVNSHSCIMDALKYVKGVYTRAFKNKELLLNVKFVRTCSPESLKKTLERYYQENTDIIYIADAVFSMDGNILPLPEIIQVLSNYPGALIVLDEAHATGCIGRTGHGILEYFDVDVTRLQILGINFVVISTLSKFGASCGAGISSNCKSLNLLMQKSLYYTNTSAIAPPLLASASEAIKILKTNPQFVKELRSKTTYARQRLKQAGFDPLGETNIIPIIVSNNDDYTKKFAVDMLNKHGIWVSAIFHVATPRLRIVINRVHTYKNIDQLIYAMVDTRASQAK